MRIVGPLFRYELTRLARRGLQPRLRAAFAGLLLVALLLAYLAAFPGRGPLHVLTHIDEPFTAEAASRFGERFLVAFLFAQAAVVVLVTPVVAAGAIGEEKDRRSLDLLLTTQLTNAEIVVGKLAARLVFVGMLLLTGLPVVVLTTLFGGVDVERLAAGYAIALLTMCSLGAFAVYLSVRRDRMGGAVLRAYVWAIGLTAFGSVCCCFQVPAFFSPFSALWVVFNGWFSLFGRNSPTDPWVLVLGYGGLHLSLATLFTFEAILGVRTCQPDPGVLHGSGGSRGGHPARRNWDAPEVDDADPLGWKERYFGGSLPGAAEVFILGIYFVPLLASLVLIGLAAGPDATLLFVGVALLAAYGGLLAAGLRAVRTVVEERRGGTLENLLTLPVARWDIFSAKLVAAARQSRLLFAVAATIVVLGVARGAIALPALVGFPLVFGGWLTAAVGFGLWLSVRCPTPERAAGWFLSVSVVVCVLPLMVGRGAGFSPLAGLWAAVPDRLEWDIYDGRFQGAILGAAAAAWGGLLFGWLAARRFERDPVAG